MSLSVVIPFHSGDRNQALLLIEWIQFLGPQEGRFFLLTQAKLQDPAILPVGWQWLTDYLDIKADWQNLVDASAANAMWTQAAREMRRLQAGPWLWLEPDAVPLTRNWLSILESEYRRGGRPFMGGHAPKGDGMDRMSGIAVYSQDTSVMCQNAMLSGKVAFDYFGAADFKNRGVHFTPLICDHFRCSPFTSQADFDARVPREAVIHHGDKSGSIYPFAKARLTGSPEAPFFVAPKSPDKDGFEPAVFLSSPVIIQRVPDRPDEITEMLKARMAEQIPVAAAATVSPDFEFKMAIEPETPEDFLNAMRRRLDWIMQQVGDDKKKRAKLYEALQGHGIECGRKKRALKKKGAAAH